MDPFVDPMEQVLSLQTYDADASPAPGPEPSNGCIYYRDQPTYQCRTNYCETYGCLTFECETWVCLYEPDSPPPDPQPTGWA
ncbi:MAG TPA: hypothetical protein VFQ45_14620 [Longimicrobium sp.]|nr:hypothetical protein [Longimicrobium sp.]